MPQLIINKEQNQEPIGYLTKSIPTLQNILQHYVLITDITLFGLMVLFVCLI